MVLRPSNEVKHMRFQTPVSGVINGSQITSNRSIRQLSILAPKKRSNVDRVAVLYQAVEPPVVNSVRKPQKPGGKRFSQRSLGFRLIRDIQVTRTLAQTFVMYFDKTVTM